MENNLGGQLQWHFDGRRLREQRKKKHLTQKRLADLAGLTQGTICEYETGKAVPSLKTLLQLSVVLTTSIDYFLGLTNASQPVVFSNILTETEQELLRVYYALPPEKRERAIGILIGFKEG